MADDGIVKFELSMDDLRFFVNNIPKSGSKFICVYNSYIEYLVFKNLWSSFFPDPSRNTKFLTYEEYSQMGDSIMKYKFIYGNDMYVIRISDYSTLKYIKGFTECMVPFRFDIYGYT